MSSRSRRTSIDQTINESLGRILDSVRETRKVDGEALAELQRLTTLAEIYKTSSRYRRRWQRTPLLIAACVTLAITSFLLFRKISVLELSLDAKVSEASFLVKSRSILNRPLSVSSVSIEDAAQLIGPNPDDLQETVSLVDDQAYATFSEARDGNAAGKITIQTLVLDDGVRAAFAQRGSDKVELRLTPAPGRPISIKILLKGTVMLAYPEENPKPVTLDLAAEVVATGTQNPLVLSFVSKEAFELARNIPITDLSLAEEEQYYNPQQTILRSFSSVKQATLYQESLNGSEVKIRKGEELEFVRLDGILRSVGIEQSAERPGEGTTAIALEFSGTAEGVNIGNLHRSGMPSTLDWLAKRQAGLLFWGVSLYAIGLIATVWSWYRNNS